MGVSKEGKTYANRYKTDLSISQTSNTGFDGTSRKICSGDGIDSALFTNCFKSAWIELYKLFKYFFVTVSIFKPLLLWMIYFY